MNLTSSHPPRILLDTTVFCGALRTDGIQRQLLRMARASLFFTPVVSRVCLLEFYRNATNGLAGVKYTYEEIEAFLDLFIYPFIEEHHAVNSVVGRYSAEIIKRREREIGEVLVELSGCSTGQALEIIQQSDMRIPLKHYDEQDFHVWVTAIQQQCDFIVTNNTKRFPQTIGNIQIKAGDFYNLIAE